MLHLYSDCDLRIPGSHLLPNPGNIPYTGITEFENNSTLQVRGTEL